MDVTSRETWISWAERITCGCQELDPLDHVL